MLFLLTGEVQIGKTRWLESLVAELGAFGVPCAGVLAPGQWVPSTGPHADANGFEKLGIDNVLLPGGERVPFARRGDLAHGPTPAFPHALAVVRDYLLDDAEALFAEAWPDHCRISPDDTGRAVILSACEFGA